MKNRRAAFGTTRRLDSKKIQATYMRDGKRHSLGTFLTEKEARKALSVVEADLTRGQWRDTSRGRVRFELYAETVLAKERGRLAPFTVQNKETLLKLWILPTFGKSPIDRITVQQVENWYSDLGSRTGAVNRRNAYYALAGIMSAAVRAEVLLDSPCRVRGAGKNVAKEREHFPHDDFLRVVDAMPDNLRPVLLVAMGAHLRVGELLGLNRGDLDAETGKLTVERQTQQVRGGLLIRETKTGKAKTVKLPRQALEAAVAYIESHPAPDNAPMFTGPKGRRLSRGYLRSQWNLATVSAGLAGVHLHDLRHTGLTLAAQTGATLKELMVRAGHVSPKAALMYQHATAERDEGIADRLSDLMAN
jgi:integrase